MLVLVFILRSIFGVNEEKSNWGADSPATEISSSLRDSSLSLPCPLLIKLLADDVVLLPDPGDVFFVCDLVAVGDSKVSSP